MSGTEDKFSDMAEHDRKAARRDLLMVFAVVLTGVLLALAILCLPEARAETFAFPGADCELTWDDEAFWAECRWRGEDLSAPQTEDFWNRTGIEFYVGELPKPYKAFCTVDGEVKTTGDMIYPPAQVICSGNGRDRVETGIRWEALPWSPEPGRAVRYGLKVNSFHAAEGRLPEFKTPDGLTNDPATFASLTLTEDNRRAPVTEQPSMPVLDETGLVLTWDPQDDADWWWVYVTRGDESMARVKATENRFPLDPILRAGTDHYRFEVSAEAEGLAESERSDPYVTWIALHERETGGECPDPPPCPDGPPPVECPPVTECPVCPECPMHPAPQIQEVIVSCGEAQ